MLQIIKHVAWRCGIAPDRAAHKVISNCPIAESIDRFYEITSASDSKCEFSAVAGCPNEANVNAVALVRVSKALREPMPPVQVQPQRSKSRKPEVGREEDKDASEVEHCARLDALSNTMDCARLRMCPTPEAPFEDEARRDRGLRCRCLSPRHLDCRALYHTAPCAQLICSSHSLVPHSSHHSRDHSPFL